MTSPIETQFLAALRELVGSAAQSGIFIDEQLTVAGYKIDVLLCIPDDVTRLAVELDGHDWHERTKQQASYDRARDRALMRSGIPTIRFTGSDVYRDANQCAREAVETLRAVQDAHKGYAAAMERIRNRPKASL